MVGFELFGGSMDAITTVGLVLGEAVALYVGYGVLASAVGATVLDTIGADTIGSDTTGGE
ncbi:hypothetical protein AUR64_03250 [Haloprofundus marisrubri]|uniref:Uncharacterized protein n=1 Tax=Haloprofundus marisrubri TaxID=1514971 RepID=A0A0W1RDM0_9EURY|nr:hypothetical protein [Haloprofundus marisrubri]KTG11532.1 hypothetical protein AUR64_03250 [Haloprofundus marisrubri]